MAKKRNKKKAVKKKNVKKRGVSRHVPKKEAKEVEEAKENTNDLTIADPVNNNEEAEGEKEDKDINNDETPPSDESEGWVRRVDMSGGQKKKVPKKKKGFFSFGFGKKKKKEEKDEEPVQKTGLGKFFASVNNIGMGKQRSLFIQSMAMMLGAGLNLVETMETLQLEIRSRAMKQIVKDIARDVQNGIPLWQAMENRYLFSPYELALVRIGEEAGHLAKNIEHLAEQQEKDRSLRAKVKMAMIYPTIVLSLMFVIVMGLGLFVLPNLIQVLIALDADLPLTTRIVIKATNIFSDYGVIFVPATVAGFITILILGKFTRFRVVTQWVIFHIPGIGSLARQATIARFGVILGGLLQAGVPLVKALESLRDVTHVASYKKFYTQLVEHIVVGDSFSKSFEQIKGSRKRLPISVQQLIVTGEQAGSLSVTLIKIAEIYEKKASETAQKLPTILEPMLLLFIGGLVGTIAFAIIVPIYSVVGNVGR